jgi:hypothetical protein
MRPAPSLQPMRAGQFTQPQKTRLGVKPRTPSRRFALRAQSAHRAKKRAPTAAAPTQSVRSRRLHAPSRAACSGRLLRAQSAFVSSPPWTSPFLLQIDCPKVAILAQGHCRGTGKIRSYSVEATGCGRGLRPGSAEYHVALRGHRPRCRFRLTPKVSRPPVVCAPLSSSKEPP